MASPGEQNTMISAQGNYLKQGHLLKRQKGRYTRESERKFCRRFCILTRKSFSYRRPGTQDKKLKTIPVKKIKYVEDVAIGTFLESSISQAEPLDFALCFQFGDEEEAYYVIAANVEEKREWMAAIRSVGEHNRNQMLKYYHPGAYGSQHPEQWSCCMSPNKRQKGCKPVSEETFTVTVLLDSYSSLTSSTMGVNQHEGSSGHSITQRDRFSSASTSSTTSTGTSGGDLESPTRKSMTSYYSIPEKKPMSVHTTDAQQTKVPMDFRKSTITINSTNSVDSGVDIRSRPVSTYTNLSGDVSGLSTPRDSWIFQQPLDEGVVVNEDVAVPSTVHMKLIHSFKFSSSLLLIPSHTKLIAGTKDGMLWTLSPECTEIQGAHLKAAGQIVSLDSFGEYIAVGSAVVQVFAISDSPPKRIIYRKAKERLMVPGRQYFVAFLGETGMLATAQLQGDSIDIWPSPSDTHLVMNPKSSISTSGKILSLSASSKSNSPLISVLLEVEKKSKLMVINWRDFCDQQPTASIEAGSINGNHIAFFSDGRNIVVAEDNCLQVYDTAVSLKLKASTSFDAEISCLSSTLVDNHVGVGLITGNFVSCFYSDHEGILKQTQYNCSINNMRNSPVVSISFVNKLRERGLCVAHMDGVLQLWKASSDDDSDHHLVVQEKSILGMELHKRGIISVPQIIEQTKKEQKIGHGVYITLPQEVVDENIQVESAFRPCGLGHYSFILPEKMLPVSQALWLCATPQKKFDHPAKIKLAHCFQSEDENHQNFITFLKADHEDIERDEDGQISVKFKEVERSQFEFPSSSYGILLDRHFCIYCLAVYYEEMEILGKVNYCLTILKPNAYPKEKAAKVYCILHFDLEGCKQLIQEQIPEDYAPIVEKQFQFETGSGRYESALEINIDDEQATRRGWMISMESERKIYAEDVNFFNYRNTECLENACTSPLNKCYPYVYPPRFVLEVSSQIGATSYLSEAIIKLTFTGAKHELSTDIQLKVLRDERDLNQPGVRSDEDYHGPATNEPHPFINGLWPNN